MPVALVVVDCEPTTIGDICTARVPVAETGVKRPVVAGKASVRTTASSVLPVPANDGIT